MHQKLCWRAKWLARSRIFYSVLFYYLVFKYFNLVHTHTTVLIIKRSFFCLLFISSHLDSVNATCDGREWYKNSVKISISCQISTVEFRQYLINVSKNLVKSARCQVLTFPFPTNVHFNILAIRSHSSFHFTQCFLQESIGPLMVCFPKYNNSSCFKSKNKIEVKCFFLEAVKAVDASLDVRCRHSN